MSPVVRDRYMANPGPPLTSEMWTGSRPHRTTMSKASAAAPACSDVACHKEKTISQN